MMKNLRIFLMVCAGIVVFFLVIDYMTDPPSKLSQSNKPNDQQAKVTPPVKVPIITEAEYISSSRPIVFKQDSKNIFFKEFLKNPDKFTGKRLNVVGKIMTIEEKEGSTFIQMYITRDYESVIVYYRGNTKFYKDDFVRVFGEGAGTVEGANRMGAAMTWPVIQAKYLKKYKPESEDED